MDSTSKKIQLAIIGSRGFIGKNLVSRIENYDIFDVTILENSNNISAIGRISDIDWIINCAGVNRSGNEENFWLGNVELIRDLLNEASKLDYKPKIINLSTININQDNIYAKTKRAGEILVEEYGRLKSTEVINLRLPNIFGKWGKPNYNSFINTYCYNKNREIDTQIFNAHQVISILHVDDLVSKIINYLIEGGEKIDVLKEAIDISIKEVIEIIDKIDYSERRGISEESQAGIRKKLYATFISYGVNQTKTADRKSNIAGSFTELFKTVNCGQFSILRIEPKMSRGNHYHDTKVEKFFVIKGNSTFYFKDKLSGNVHQIEVDDKSDTIIYALPGTFHTIKNKGKGELILAIWASELFDEYNPDTYYR